MPAALAPLPVALARFRFRLVVAGRRVPVSPTFASAPTLTRTPAEDDAQGAGPFYFRDALSGPLTFHGPDYALLLAIAQSSTPCQVIGLHLDLRPGGPGTPWQNAAHKSRFSAQDCAPFDLDKCQATVTVQVDDPYRLLLDAYDTEINLLGTPDQLRRQAVTAELATLAPGTRVEFLRIDSTAEADYVGTDGWGVFLRNTSFIAGTLTQGNTRERTVLLFRYRLVGVPETRVIGTNGAPDRYVPVDKSAQGYAPLYQAENTTAHTIDYVKSPEIAGFKTYKIGTYNEWHDPLNPARTSRHGDALLLLPCGTEPAAYGFNNADYLRVTGPGGGQSLGGANNSPECPDCLNVRRSVGTNACKALYWRFGAFRFGRCFPLRDGLYYLLQQTLAPHGPAGAALVPPRAIQLGDFLNAFENPATGESGDSNEVYGLVLSAASDVKRYGASEPATRLLLSLKTLLADLAALYDCGWFVDPVTGWFRLEHRAYLDAAHAAGNVLALPAAPEAQGPRRSRPGVSSCRATKS